MLKAIQVSGCVTQRWSWKPLTFISISSKPFSSFSPYPYLKLLPSVNTTIDSSIPSTRRVRFAPFYASSSPPFHSAVMTGAGLILWFQTQNKDVKVFQSPSSQLKRQGVRNIKFCQWCGGPTKHDIPDGEEKLRAICTICGKITYQNPKMVVGCLIDHDNKVLLCKRNIQPSHGLWTLPAGYLEIGESAVEGAIRETREEANADVEVISPFAQLDIPLIGQTYMIFLAKLKKPHFSPGPESSECQLFPLDDIPFNSLSFSSMVVTLSLYVEDVKAGNPKFHYGTINKRPGTSPSDIHAYTLDHHMQT